MKRAPRRLAALFPALLAALASGLLAGALYTAPLFANGLPTVKPEEVGLSQERLERIGALMQGYVDRGEAAGMLALVARQGKMAYFDTWGYQDREAKTPMSPDTIFRIYSMTKPITSVAVMMLYEEGHFFLTDPVSRYLPELADLEVAGAADSPEAGNGGGAGNLAGGGASNAGSNLADGTNNVTVKTERPVTIQDLLRHTGGFTYGFFGDTPVDKLYREAGVLMEGKTIAETVEKLGKLPLLYQPGTHWHYSVGIDILGRLVEVVSGMPLDRFFEQRIFSPLGMVDTAFTVAPEKLDRFAQLYSPQGSQFGADAWLRGNFPKEIEVAPAQSSRGFVHGATHFSGGGGLVSTAADYLRFCQMILNGGTLDGVRLLSRKSVELMSADALEGIEGFGTGGSTFGLGFAVVEDLGGSGSLGSPGALSWGGAAGTRFWVDPQEQLIGVFMVQIMPHRTRMGEEFRLLTYQAIDD